MNGLKGRTTGVEEILCVTGIIAETTPGIYDKRYSHPQFFQVLWFVRIFFIMLVLFSFSYLFSEHHSSRAPVPYNASLYMCSALDDLQVGFSPTLFTARILRHYSALPHLVSS